MHVGVIVPVHGWAPYLAEALDSVVGERPAAVVVVDDASPSPVPGATVRRAVRGGPAAARATGLAALDADVDVVALCDADDAWRPGFLGAALRALGSADVAIGRAEVVGPDGRPTGERWPPVAAPSFASNRIATPAVVMRRAALERAGGFASDLERAEDWDLWLRLLRSGARFAAAEGAVVAVRRRAGALTADVAALARAQLAVHACHAALAASEDERRRVEAADLRALAAGLARERDFSGARDALRAARRLAPRRPADVARESLLAVPGARAVVGRRDPYRRR